MSVSKSDMGLSLREKSFFHGYSLRIIASAGCVIGSGTYSSFMEARGSMMAVPTCNDTTDAGIGAAGIGLSVEGAICNGMLVEGFLSCSSVLG